MNSQSKHSESVQGAKRPDNAFNSFRMANFRFITLDSCFNRIANEMRDQDMLL